MALHVQESDKSKKKIISDGPKPCNFRREVLVAPNPMFFFCRPSCQVSERALGAIDQKTNALAKTAMEF